MDKLLLSVMIATVIGSIQSIPIVYAILNITPITFGLMIVFGF